MSVSEKNRQIVDIIKQADLSSYKTLRDLMDMAICISDVDGDNDIEYAMKITDFIKKKVQTLEYTQEMNGLYWDAMKLEAPYKFESFLYYMEKNRAPKKRFYQPRAKTLHTIVDDLQELDDGNLDFLGVSLPPRVGKALANNTKILTKKGWKNHGDLVYGDYVVGYDGKYKKVLQVHPKCMLDCKVEFTDGSSIVCHENHEWYVYNRHRAKYEKISTIDMINTNIETGEPHKRGHRYFYQIPKHEYIAGIKKELKVKPYTLGVWLGDGRNENPDICGDKKDIKYVLNGILDDDYVVAWHTTHKDTFVEYYGIYGLRNGLQQYGMCYSRKRTEKHIPVEYLTSTIEDRLNLLAGLIDTDGCLIKNEHRYQYTTSDNKLKEDFISLISTFGWRASITEVEPSTSSSGIVGRKKYWVIAFNPDCYIPCRLERKQLHVFSKQRMVAIKSITRVEPVEGNCITVDGGLYLAGNRLTVTHNSTLCIFFLAWIIGRKPNSHNAMSGHSGILADGFYSEVYSLTTSKDYTFNEIFPSVHLESKSAEKKELNFNDPDRFSTLTCRGIDGTWTGSVDISSDGYLYVDDLVRDRTESLSPIRLENRYQDYLNVLVDRKNDGAKELMVGTRWNVLDPLGKVEKDKKDNPRYRFRRIPALNEEGLSNFDYDYGVGFSTEYYQDIRSRLDKNEWEAKYQQKPFVREGLLFPENELQMYNGVLPDGGLVRKISVCDVAWGGGDSLSEPFAYVYEDGSVYIADWIFNRGDKTVTKPIVVGKALRHKPNQMHFEADNGGHEYADDIDRQLKEQGFKTNISSKKSDNKVSKLAKIIQYAPDIKRSFYFLDEKHRDSEYQDAMDELNMFVQIGANEHDDAPDSLTQLAIFISGGLYAKCEAQERPW